MKLKLYYFILKRNHFIFKFSIKIFNKKKGKEVSF